MLELVNKFKFQMYVYGKTMERLEKFPSVRPSRKINICIGSVYLIEKLFKVMY